MNHYKARKDSHTQKEVVHQNEGPYMNREGEGLQLVSLPPQQHWYKSPAAEGYGQADPPPRQEEILGLSVRTFWVVVAVLVLVLAGGIGGGVGGGLAIQKGNCKALRYVMRWG